MSGVLNAATSSGEARPIKITILGAGNVAQALGGRWKSQGALIRQIYGRSLEKARSLAADLGAEGTDRLEDIFPTSDLYIIAVSDQAVEEVALALQSILPPDAFIAHTSGTLASAIFAPYFKNYGVVYPLQTFSANRTIDFEAVPVFIEASNENAYTVLLQAASFISPVTYRLTDDKRQALHVAAVFANNFTNYLYGVGEAVLQKEGIPFDVLIPLIQETAAKVVTRSPKAAQTGPAKRGDLETVERHKAYLRQYFPAYAALYEALSDQIIKRYS